MKNLKITSLEDCKKLATKLGTTPEEVAKAFNIKVESDSLSAILSLAIENKDLPQMWEVYKKSPSDSKVKSDSLSAIEKYADLNN